MDSEVLTLLLTARYVGSPAFNALAKDLDVLTSKASGLAKTGAAISAMGTIVTAATVGLAVGIGEAIKQSSAYEDAVMRMVGAHVIATNQVNQLQQAIMSTSNTYGQNSIDIAKSLYFVTSTMDGLGYSIANNKQVAKEFFDYIIPSMGALVAASGHGLPGSISWQQAAQDVTHVAGSLNVPLNQWPKMIGSMDVVETFAGLSQQQLLAAVLRAAPTARLLGVGYPDLFAAVGAAATAGVPGAREGTEWGAAFRMMLGNKKAQSALASLGISTSKFFNKNGSLIDQGSILAAIYSKLSGVSDPAKRFNLQQDIFGAVGNRAMGLLMQPSTLAIYQRLMGKEKNNPIGFMLQDALKQTHDFRGSVAILAAAIRNLAIIVGGPLKDALKPFIDRLSALIIKLSDFLSTAKGQDLLKNLPKLAFGALGTGAVLGPAMTYGGGLLRDWALNRDKMHGSYLKDLARWTLGADKMRADGSPMMIEFGRQRIDFLQSLMKKAPGGKFSIAGVPDKYLAQMMNKYTSVGGSSNPMVDYRLRSHVNKNWEAIAKAYGFDPKGGPLLSSLESKYLPTKPEEVLSSSGTARKFFGSAFGHIWDFGQKFGPMGLAKSGFHIATAIPGGIASAFGFLKNLPKNALSGIVAAFKGIGPALATAVPAILGFGSALLPVIAVALLVVGAITTLVLIFLRFRKEAMATGKAILDGLAPIFKFFMGFVQSTLKMIGKAWSDHKKEIDGAIKGLLQAFKSALPFFQVVFGVIAGVLGVVFRVVGYLISAFLDALPHIINVFSAIFRILGDLGRIIIDIIHGKWGQAWKDAQALLGHAWEGIKQLLGGLWSFITGVFGRLWKDIGPTVEKIWTNVLQPFFTGLPARAGKALGDLAGSIGQGLQSLFGGHKGGSGGFADASMGIVGSLSQKVGPALARLWTSVIWPFFQSLPGKIAAGLGNLWTLVFGGGGGKGGKGGKGGIAAALLGSVLSGIQTLGPQILAALGGLVGRFFAFWGNLFARLHPLLDKLWKTKVIPFFNGLPNAITKELTKLKAKWDNFWNVTWPKQVKPALENLWNKHIKPFLESLPGRIWDALQPLWAKWQEFWTSLGPKILPFLWMLFTKYIGPFLLHLPENIFRLLLFIIPKFWDFFHMLGKVQDAIWNWFWSNVLLPFLRSLPGKFTDALKGLSGALLTFFTNLGKNVVKAFGDGLKGLGGAVSSAVNKIPGVTALGSLFTHGRAGGGQTPGPEWSWVGEHGPELRHLAGGTTIYPHQQSVWMTRPLAGGSRMTQLHIAALHVDAIHGLEHLGQPKQPPGKIQRTPAEEYLFARQIQQQREAVWDRYPNTSRNFDSTYRRAYQYYG